MPQRRRDRPRLPPELTATGSTDLDPMEWDDMKSNISLVEDGSFEMTKLEMPAYFQILSWVDHQPTELLRKRANKDVVYSDFRKTPDSMRLQIVELKLERACRFFAASDHPRTAFTKPITTPNDKPIYEVRGFTQEGGIQPLFRDRDRSAQRHAHRHVDQRRRQIGGVFLQAPGLYFRSNSSWRPNRRGRSR